MRKILLLTVLLAVPLLAWPVTAQPPVADYGDAPDPNFPSLFASNGPRHLVLTDCWVGLGATAEPDALVPDADIDDGTPIIFASLTKNGVWMAWIYFPITLSQTSTGPHFLNALLDCNSSGTWCDPASPNEWVIRNYKLPLSHLPGQTVYYCLGGFTWVTFYDSFHWLRITLSDTPITANVIPCGWDGQVVPSFTYGETEDWELAWHYDPWDAQGGGTPGLVPPSRPDHPPLPQPIPECNKTGTIYQDPPPTHTGHSGTFGICVKNTSPNHPMHILSGPTVTDQTGSPNTIIIEPLTSTVIQPGGQVCAWGGWDFTNPAPNSTWCDFEVEIEPQGQVVIIGNVGNYSKPNDCYQTSGGSFVESAPRVSSLTHVGASALLITLALISVYFVVRRQRLATRE